MEIQEQTIEQFKGQTRLPEFAVPKRYELTIKLDLSACTFSGCVAIDASINKSTRFLVLNALELVVHRVSFTNFEKQVSIFCSTCFVWNSCFYLLWFFNIILYFFCLSWLELEVDLVGSQTLIKYDYYVFPLYHEILLFFSFLAEICSM